MIKTKIQPQILLSTLWIFVLLNMVFRDLHQFGKKSFIEEIMTGKVNGIEITDELMLIGGFLVELPILMVLLSRILVAKVNKWANILASIITMLVLASALPSADLDDLFFLIIEFPAFFAIILIAWELPSLIKTNSQFSI
ncbi:DUF6326 family protein [Flagellimonas sp. CMM7]|uniref:DUF6326 family protein n=1 Tax=Flagellimonas sp. CMM7 TaxID=2654676 RepID=UPI001969DFF1|nr:DUF6326 family protein [Flagellimonas sp. CMM7]UII80075.1 DUF6326 family protein [Flagellimonas sp. CMM7]